MLCNVCGHKDDKVIDSREKQDALTIRRRRQCLKCGNRFTTYETHKEAPQKKQPEDKNQLKLNLDW